MVTNEKDIRNQNTDSRSEEKIKEGKKENTIRQTNEREVNPTQQKEKEEQKRTGLSSPEVKTDAQVTDEVERTRTIDEGRNPSIR